MIDNKNNKNNTRHYQAIKDMENNVDFCNKAIQEFINPITYNNTCIKVRNNIDDYYRLVSLTNLLRSYKTRKMLQAIKKERNKKKWLS